MTKKNTIILLSAAALLGLGYVFLVYLPDDRRKKLLSLYVKKNFTTKASLPTKDELDVLTKAIAQLSNEEVKTLLASYSGADTKDKDNSVAPLNNKIKGLTGTKIKQGVELVKNDKEKKVATLYIKNATTPTVDFGYQGMGAMISQAIPMSDGSELALHFEGNTLSSKEGDTLVNQISLA